jgi:hypothetical protein
MYNGRKDMPYFSPPRHLEKALDMIYIMHYFLLSFVIFNEK